MRFIATKTSGTFNIHLADEHAAKPEEEPGTRKGEPVVSVTCVDEDGDKMPCDFYSSDALDATDVELFKAILDKLSAHAVQTLG